jgi:hypothetical protein
MPVFAIGGPKPPDVMRFEVLTSVTVRITEFYHDDGGSIVHQNVGRYLPYYRMSQPSRK